MSLGSTTQAWSALYDHLYLNGELEQKMLSAIRSGESISMPLRLSEKSRSLAYASQGEISDFFRDRRDYIESVATLDLIISVERSIRADLEMRSSGQKSNTSLVGAALMNIRNVGGRPPAARRLLAPWRMAQGANDQLIDAIEEGMQYRNWLAHGSLGSPPLISNPFSLDQPVSHIFFLIQKEL